MEARPRGAKEEEKGRGENKEKKKKKDSLDIVRHFGGRERSLPGWLDAAREESLAARGAAVLPEAA